MRGSSRLLGPGGDGVGDGSSGSAVATAVGQFLRRRSLGFQFDPEDLGPVVHEHVAVWSERDPAPVAFGQFLQLIQHDVGKVPYSVGPGVLGHFASNRSGAILRIQCKASARSDA